MDTKRKWKWYELKESETVVLPLYENTIYKDVLADAPRIVENGGQVPVFLEVKDASPSDFYPVYMVYIYDAGTNLQDTSDDILRYSIDLNYDDTCWGTPLERIDDAIWTRIQNVDPSLFTKHGDEIYIRVRYDAATLCWPSESDWDMDNEPVGVEILSGPLPHLTNWYAGDQHVHSQYTSDFYEFGVPVNGLVAGGKAFGLDYVLVTDHSYDVYDNWNDLENEVGDYGGFFVIRGEEVSAARSVDSWPNDPLMDGAGHLLVFNNGLIDTGHGTAESWKPTQNENQVLNSITGFSYIAHPYDRNWQLPLWGILDASYPMHRWDFNLMSTNYLETKVKGFEIWNFGQQENELGPDFNNNVPGIPTSDRYGGVTGPDQVALEHWRTELLSGKHLFAIGNSDAHELNKLGGVRTYVYSPSGLTESGILDALRNGRSIITNGPLVVFTANGANVGDTITVVQNGEINISIQGNPGEFTNNGAIYYKIWRGIIGGSDIYTGYSGQLNSFNSYSASRIFNAGTACENKKCYFRIEARAGLNDIYRAYTNPIWVEVTPADITPPTIFNTYASPASPSAYQAIDIYSNITDGSGISSASVSYSTDGGTTWNSISMTKVSGSGKVNLYEAKNV